VKKIIIYFFVIIFALVAILIGVDYWSQKTYQRSPMGNLTASFRAEYYLSRISHPNAKVADDAYWKLNDLYFTKWQTYNLILESVEDSTPISFLIEKDSMAVPGKPSRTAYMPHRKPIFYKTDRIYCRTVGEALLTLAYREFLWKTDFEGNWQVWWQANRGYYGH
jgi:hypothetical protein